MRHIGDRDQQVPAAGIFGIAVRLGPDRVVEIPGVLAVDGHQGQPAQVFAPRGRGRSRGGRLGPGGLGEHGGQIVLVDRDQAEGAGFVDPPEALHHPDFAGA